MRPFGFSSTQSSSLFFLFSPLFIQNLRCHKFKVSFVEKEEEEEEERRGKDWMRHTTPPPTPTPTLGRRRRRRRRRLHFPPTSREIFSKVATTTTTRRRRRRRRRRNRKRRRRRRYPAKQEEATTTTVTFVVELAGDVLSQCQRPTSRVAEKAQNVEPDRVPLDARGEVVGRAPEKRGRFERGVPRPDDLDTLDAPRRKDSKGALRTRETVRERHRMAESAEVLEREHAGEVAAERKCGRENMGEFEGRRRDRRNARRRERTHA